MARGFTVLQAQLLPEEGFGKFSKGLEPFGVPGDFATPNDRYFDRVAGIIRYAGSRGMFVAVNPVWLGCCDGGWRGVVKTNGTAKCLEYGRYLGRKFKRLENILWLHGGDTDPQPWLEEIRSIAEGIRETAPTHRLHAAHCGSSTPSRERLSGEPWLTVNYSCDSSPDSLGVEQKQFHVYRNSKRDYQAQPTLPLILGNAGYDRERTPAPQVQRRQAWWAMLSGASGHTAADRPFSRFEEGWEAALDSQTSRSMSHLASLLGSVRWQRLVPDFDHVWMPAGFGDFNETTSPGGDDYAAVAADPEGVMLLAYLPSPRLVTLDLSKFKLPVLASWFDPVSGVLRNVNETKAELPNVGRHDFLPPGRNSAGDGDWVLVLDGRPIRRPLRR